jgi:xanthine dehydrogenase YagS FAD-binding subunit
VQPFSYITAHTITDAIQWATKTPGARFLAGGTTLVDLMKSGPEHPTLVIDINRLPDLDYISYDSAKRVLRFGALTRMSTIAADMDVREGCPSIAEALLFAASGQLRNMASIAGNLLQRTRCVYFRDRSFPCNKREPGSGCSAIGGENRNLAVLGTSDHCIANYAGDFAVALSALDGIIYASSPAGERAIPVTEFHVLPSDTPHVESVLEPSELITRIEVPISKLSRRSHYLKIRDRSSYEFASTSVAVAADLHADGTMRDVRLALGGLAAKPWRAFAAEDSLRGRNICDARAISEATELVLAGAKPQKGNRYKIEQARAGIVRAFRFIESMPRLSVAKEGSN